MFDLLSPRLVTGPVHYPECKNNRQKSKTITHNINKEVFKLSRTVPGRYAVPDDLDPWITSVTVGDGRKHTHRPQQNSGW